MAECVRRISGRCVSTRLSYEVMVMRGGEVLEGGGDLPSLNAPIHARISSLIFVSSFCIGIPFPPNLHFLAASSKDHNRIRAARIWIQMRACQCRRKMRRTWPGLRLEDAFLFVQLRWTHRDSVSDAITAGQRTPCRDNISSQCPIAFIRRV